MKLCRVGKWDIYFNYRYPPYRCEIKHKGHFKYIAFGIGLIRVINRRWGDSNSGIAGKK